MVAVTSAALGIGTYGVKFARTTSDLFVASRAVSPWWNAAAISGEYLSAASFLGVVRADAEVRRLRPLAPGRLHRGLPHAAAVRRRPAAALRLLHDPRLRRGPAARAVHAAARGGDRAADQRLLPRAATERRGRDAARDHRRAVLGRRRHREPHRRAQRRPRRDARRDVRAGLPVLGEGVRDRGPGAAAAHLPGRAAGPGRPVRRRAPDHRPERHGRRARQADHAHVPGHGRDENRPGGRLVHPTGHVDPRRRRHQRADRRRVVAARLGVRPRLADPDLQPAAGHVPRDDGPAAHPRPLLHQPGRLRRAPNHGPRARPARRLLPVPGRLRPARPGLHARALRHRRHGQRRAAASPPPRGPARWATSSPRSSPRARSPPS